MEQHNLSIFDIRGEYGHFRKFNTTSSPLTYSVPTRTALIGVLGAILGIEREVAPGKFRKDQTSVHEMFAKKQANIAIQLLNPIKKVNMAFNLLDTGKSGSSFFNISNRTQIEFELLKDPKFRVFIQLKDDTLQNRLCQCLQKRSHHFTPYLGLSQFTADIDWVGVTTGTVHENVAKDYIPIQSVINLATVDKEPPLLFRDIKVTAETMPITLNKQRIVEEYAEVLIEQQGRPISVATPVYVETAYGNLVYL